MLKSETLVLLVHSMTKSEKRAFRLTYKKGSTTPDYLVLFDIIDSNQRESVANIKSIFTAKKKGASFGATSRYLHKKILDKLLMLREEQDSNYSLFNSIMRARILFEKSLFDECFNLLKTVIEDSIKYENFYAFLLASKLELEYLLNLNFLQITEKQLLKKHLKINETLQFFRKTNEVASLYELLKYRVIHKGHVRSNKQKFELNDLVVSEMSIIATSKLENFEIKKLHQLFQANYLISVGDNKSALRSFIELNSLFEANKHLWSNPPIYYLLTLEGMLESLRKIRDYDGMKLFVDKLKKITSNSLNFNANVHCLIFLNELFPKLDTGNFEESLKLMNSYKKTLYNKSHLLSLSRQAELSLYSALILFGNKDYKSAHKFINMIVLKGKNYINMPLYRTIRLVNLMILYELKSFELITYETRSLRREIKNADKSYRIEKYMLKFLNKENIPVLEKKREKFWQSVLSDIEDFKDNVFEQQVLKIFDFTAWIESKVRRVPLGQVISSKL